MYYEVVEIKLIDDINSVNYLLSTHWKLMKVFNENLYLMGRPHFQYLNSKITNLKDLQSIIKESKSLLAEAIEKEDKEALNKLSELLKKASDFEYICEYSALKVDNIRNPEIFNPSK